MISRKIPHCVELHEILLKFRKITWNQRFYWLHEILKCVLDSQQHSVLWRGNVSVTQSTVNCEIFFYNWALTLALKSIEHEQSFIAFALFILTLSCQIFRSFRREICLLRPRFCRRSRLFWLHFYFTRNLLSFSIFYLLFILILIVSQSSSAGSAIVGGISDNGLIFMKNAKIVFTISILF